MVNIELILSSTLYLLLTPLPNYTHPLQIVCHMLFSHSFSLSCVSCFRIYKLDSVLNRLISLTKMAFPMSDQLLEAIGSWHGSMSVSIHSNVMLCVIANTV